MSGKEGLSNHPAVGVVVGLLTAGASFLARIHFNTQANLCNSGLGAIGQAFSSNLTTNCQVVTTVYEFSKICIFIGIGMVIIGIIGLVGAALGGGRDGQGDGRGLFR